MLALDVQEEVFNDFSLCFGSACDSIYNIWQDLLWYHVKS